MAELIQSNIQKAIGSPDLKKQKFRSLEMIGKYSSNHSDISINHDQYLADIYAEIVNGKSLPLTDTLPNKGFNC